MKTLNAPALAPNRLSSRKRRHNPNNKRMQSTPKLELNNSGEYLEKLNDGTLTKESTVGAVSNMFKGAMRLLFAKGERTKGALQMGQGIIDVLDVIPSAVVDGIRFVTGPKGVEKGQSKYRFNISRAIGSVEDVKDPLGAVGAASAIVHAAGFKLVSDSIKAARQSSISTSTEMPKAVKQQSNIKPKEAPTYSQSA